jgi:Fe-S-cluster-containing dehydrogenase component/uncharacterized protein YbcV (DUF1398 family)
MEKKYWQSIEETNPDYQPPQEESSASMMEILSDESNKSSSSRRDFLKWCGISLFSATVVSACENPIKKAIPYLHQPETLIPGTASWYASSIIDGNLYCGVLVKTRDGRPIKIEGNNLCPFTKGGTSAMVQASVLSLYDDGARYKKPLKDGQPIAWAKADHEITQTLNEFSAQGRKSFLVTPTLLSPSTRAVIQDLRTRFPQIEVITWDAISYEAIRQSHQASFNQNIIPDYRFERAELIVSFSADFLGTWLSPVAFADRYAQTRTLTQGQSNMSRHIQFEAGMSVTGSNADERIPVKPSEEMSIIISLYNELASITGNTPLNTQVQTTYNTAALAQDILNHKGRAIIVCGHNNVEAQILINGINMMAGSYGNTLDASQSLQMGYGDNMAMLRMIDEIESGNIGAVMFYKVNPLFNHPQASRMSEALKRTEFTVSFATAKDETSLACTYVLPDNHFLESWNDAEPVAGLNALAQPAMQPIFNTRQFQSTLLAWQGRDTDFHQYLKNSWQKNIFPTQAQLTDFNSFWVNSLQAGVYQRTLNTPFSATISTQANGEAASRLMAIINAATAEEFVAYESIALSDGRYANNPWLQELPDPITKISWDNFAAVSSQWAQQNNLSDGDIISINGLSIPMIIQPGQAYGSVSMALGYGHHAAGKSADKVGVNVFPLLVGGSLSGNITQFEVTGKGYAFARSQTHHSMEGRDIVRESTLDKYRENPKAGNEIRDYHLKHMVTLYPEQIFEGHHWVLMVDLNACTGCSTCVIACQAENNTPVVGKDEVRRRRIMHWMRIDRYYTGDISNPSVVFQPLMCQHCDHAPCENVCPVAATSHSSEGINQMVYNRCVGTKYCINNCPYKVRRFNWFAYAMNDKFDYHMNSDLGRMVLNPDVTVRERGVVEKCSFCIQRIQDGKKTAKNEHRKLQDGDVIPSCAQSCPSKALVFGDLNDPESRVAKLIQDPRNYHLLEELHTLPTVGYMTKIRNPKKA